MLAKGGSIGQKEEKKEIPQRLVDLAEQLQAVSDISGKKDFAMEKALELQDQIKEDSEEKEAEDDGRSCRISRRRRRR